MQLTAAATTVVAVGGRRNSAIAPGPNSVSSRRPHQQRPSDLFVLQAAWRAVERAGWRAVRGQAGRGAYTLGSLSPAQFGSNYTGTARKVSRTPRGVMSNFASSRWWNAAVAGAFGRRPARIKSAWRARLKSSRSPPPPHLQAPESQQAEARLGCRRPGRQWACRGSEHETATRPTTK